jgi:16S rRNA (uracil1498-N3)-methyltransferase
MQIFYAPDIAGSEYTLDENESRHCIRVLRMKAGSELTIIDGKGGIFSAVILKPDAKACIVSVTGSINDLQKRDYRLHIAISPLKNPDRFEWFIEKSVELGVDEITPLICDNTEKPNIRKDRIQNLIISAMKQSLKSTLPVLGETASFGDFVSKHSQGCRMIAHCDQTKERSSIAEVCPKGTDALILIGPEGDFSGTEISMAVEAGFIPVHLGASRLRSETAGIAACHSVYFLNQ